MMKQRAILLLLALITACDLPLVPERRLRDVYDFRLLTPEPRVLRWPIGSEVRVYVAEDQDAARTAALHSALENGIRVWNAAALYGEVKLVQTRQLADADALLRFSSTLPPLDTGNCPPGGGLAYTTFCLDTSGAHLASFPQPNGGETRVKFIVTVRAQTTLDADAVRRLVAHELGHVLGIGQHSARQTDLLYGGMPARSDLSPADRATLQVLYHTRPDITP